MWVDNDDFGCAQFTADQPLQQGRLAGVAGPDDEAALDGWSLGEQGGDETPLDGLSIPAGGYLVLVADDSV